MYVYLLQSERFPSKRYIGITSDIEQRLIEHNQGKSPHTSKFRPWELKVSICFDDKDKAAAFEQYLKRGSGHAFARRHFW
jgi:putative endonuclease